MKIRVHTNTIKCKDGSTFIGASCQGDSLPKDVGIPENQLMLRWHIRFNGIDSNSFESDRDYEIECSDIRIDERPGFKEKLIIRVTPVSCDVK